MLQDRWKTLIALAALLIPLPLDLAFAAEEIPKGVVIPKVSCKGNEEHSYALYLPSNYSPSRKWPIIYAFDPGGRGQVSAEVFRLAAEEYGYIFAGSNNSRNRASVPLSSIIESLWDDTHRRLSIDDRRIYAAGMSGGARVASRLGFAYEGLIAGVILCSGGYPSDITTSTRRPFALFGTAGNDDFNQPELAALNEALKSRDAPHRIIFFTGGHDWPPPQVTSAALAWMELQAIRTGRRPKDDLLVSRLFERAVQEARAFETANDLYSAYLSYRSLVDDFKELREVAEFERKVEELKSSKEVRESLENERRIAGKQQRLFAGLEMLIDGLKTPEQLVETWSKLRRTIKDLRSQSRQTKDSGDRRVARRVLDQLFIGSLESAAAHHERLDYEAAAIRLEVADEVKPNDPGLLYILAREYAAGGRKKKAIETLKRAAGSGFCDAARLERDIDFNSLRGEAEYKKLLEEMKNERLR